MGLYSFTDTTEQPAAATLPAEAMSINGTFIENEISGYRTLYVKGRELIGNDIESYQVGNTPGAYYRQKRLLSRTITVGYQLLCDDEEDFRDKYNELNALLNFEQAQLIFNDEADKYFVGTKATVTEPPAGRNNVRGEFSIFCADPYKYALTPKTFNFTDSGDGYLTATIVNGGTVAVPIDYEITHSAENGFVGIVGANGAMQFGYADEVDTATGTMSQTLVDLADGDDIVAEADSNISAVIEFTENGSLEAYTFNNTYSGKTERVARMVNNTKTSSGTSWQAAGRVLTLSEAATDFSATGRLWFENSKLPQIGFIDLTLLDANGTRFARLLTIKRSSGTIVAAAECSVGGKKFKDIRFNATSDSGGGTKSKPDGAIFQIQKSGGTFKFNFSGTTGSITAPELENTACAKVVLSIGLWARYEPSQKTAIMYIKDFRFVKNNVPFEYDVPNRYQPGDVLTIVGREAKAYKNGTPCLDDEIVGTQYFNAEVGANTIDVVWSDWATDPVTATATIREAWL